MASPLRIEIYYDNISLTVDHCCSFPQSLQRCYRLCLSRPEIQVAMPPQSPGNGRTSLAVPHRSQMPPSALRARSVATTTPYSTLMSVYRCNSHSQLKTCQHGGPLPLYTPNCSTPNMQWATSFRKKFAPHARSSASTRCFAGLIAILSIQTKFPLTLSQLWSVQ